MCDDDFVISPNNCNRKNKGKKKEIDVYNLNRHHDYKNFQAISISRKDTKSNVEGKERLRYKLGEGGVDVYQK